MNVLYRNVERRNKGGEGKRNPRVRLIWILVSERDIVLKTLSSVVREVERVLGLKWGWRFGWGFLAVKTLVTIFRGSIYRLV